VTAEIWTQGFQANLMYKTIDFDEVATGAPLLDGIPTIDTESKGIASNGSAPT
jgi:hypothetical protein